MFLEQCGIRQMSLVRWKWATLNDNNQIFCHLIFFDPLERGQNHSRILEPPDTGFGAAVAKITDMMDQQIFAHLGQVWLSAQAVRIQSSIV